MDAGEQIPYFEKYTNLSHANTLDETDFIEFSGSTEPFIGPLRDKKIISLDMVNIAQKTTISVYNKIDGVNYRLRSFKRFPDDYNTNILEILAILEGLNQDMKITLRSGVGSGATFTLTVAAGAVTAAAVTDGGNDHIDGDLITLRGDSQGDDNATGIITVVNGVIQSIAITGGTSGTNYLNADTATAGGIAEGSAKTIPVNIRTEVKA